MTNAKIDYNIIDKKLSEKYNKIDAANYINYLKKLENSKNAKKELINPWFCYKTTQEFIDYYNKVKNIGLCLDGDTITIQLRGIVFDFNAYKNRVLLIYPETKFDIQLVRETDEFSFYKKNGDVFYDHKINNTFDEKPIIGAYCIIKNKLGNFLETISLQELEKIRKTAKTDYIWREWTSEMYLKTIIKRACKRHFKNITTEMEEQDNQNYNLENPLDIELKTKQEIENISSLDDLKKYYHDNKEAMPFKKSFNFLIAKRKEELSNDNT